MMIMTAMATIAMLTKDNKVKANWLWDKGELDWTGRVLVENYNDFAKAEELINLGDLKELGASPDQCEVIKRYGKLYDIDPEFLALPKKEQERLKKDLDKSTIAYHRDCGYELDISEYPNIQAYLDSIDTIEEDVTTNYFLGSNDKHEPQWYVVDDKSAFKPIFIDKNNVHHENFFLAHANSYNVVDYDGVGAWDSNKYEKQVNKLQAINIENYISKLQQKYSLGFEKPYIGKVKSHFGWDDAVVVCLTQPHGNESLKLKVPICNIQSNLEGFEREVLGELLDSLESKDKPSSSIKNERKDIKQTPLYKILDKEYRDSAIRDNKNILEQASHFAYIG